MNTKIIYNKNYSFEVVIKNDNIIANDLNVIMDNVKDLVKFTALISFIDTCLNDNIQISKDKFRYIGDNIYEIKYHSINQKEYRFFNFFLEGKRIIITNSYVKKEQKTSLKEISKAKKIKDNFLECYINEKNKI